MTSMRRFGVRSGRRRSASSSARSRAVSGTEGVNPTGPRRSGALDDRRCVELAERGLERPATAVVEAVDRALRLLHTVGDLDGAEPDDVTQHEYLTLLVGEPVERLAKRVEALELDLVVALVRRADLLEGNLPARPQVVQRGVAGHAKDPRRERHLALLVLLDLVQQLGEQRLRDVL